MNLPFILPVRNRQMNSITNFVWTGADLVTGNSHRHPPTQILGMAYIYEEHSFIVFECRSM